MERIDKIKDINKQISELKDLLWKEVIESLLEIFKKDREGLYFHCSSEYNDEGGYDVSLYPEYVIEEEDYDRKDYSEKELKLMIELIYAIDSYDWYYSDLCNGEYLNLNYDLLIKEYEKINR